MKLNMSSARLTAAVSLVAGFAARKTTLPVLGNIRLEAMEGGLLVLTATDLDNAARVEVEASVEEAGTLTVPADRLAAIAQRFPAPDVRLTSKEGDALLVVSGRSRLDLKGIPASEFPHLTIGAGESVLSLTGGMLAALDQAVDFCVIADNKRGEGYRGVGVFMEEGELVVAGVDGHRFSEVRTTSADIQAAPSMLVPKGVMGRAGKAFGADEPVEVLRADNFLSFRGPGGRVILMHRALSAEFVPYQKVLSATMRQVSRWIEADKPALIQALERVAVVANATEVAVVRLEAQDSTLRIYAQTSDAGQAVEEVEVDHDGGAILSHARAPYLLEMLARVDGPRVRLEYSDGVDNPILIGPADPDGARQRTMLLAPIIYNSTDVGGWPKPAVQVEMRGKGQNPKPFVVD